MYENIKNDLTLKKKSLRIEQESPQFGAKELFSRLSVNGEEVRRSAEKHKETVE